MSLPAHHFRSGLEYNTLGATGNVAWPVVYRFQVGLSYGNSSNQSLETNDQSLIDVHSFLSMERTGSFQTLGFFHRMRLFIVCSSFYTSLLTTWLH